ncbi:MAG TPA: glycosyltransferase [Gaiellaceae bacterium]|nr:glycosyltransferase [Gaiellaceae bacterium]
MPRILFLAYHFPPVGGAGVQRNAKFAKYLPEFGYDSIVVTGPGRSASRWTPEDDTLLGDVPDGTLVRRVLGEPPASLTRSERWLDRRTAWQRWWIDGVLRAGRAFADEIDLIYVGMAPYESAEAAAQLARELGKPWVADLQDPWALDEMWIYPTGIHRRRDLARMRRLLGTADAIVMNTGESMRKVLARCPELRDKLMVAVPNGYDAADFEAELPTRIDGKFVIAHTGYLHTALGRHHRKTARARRLLGGANGRVDILTRSHVFLLDAIDRLIAEQPSLEDVIELHLAGVTSPEDVEAGRHPCVRFLGYVPHEQSVRLIRTADLLFLPLHDLPPGERLSIVPGKTYEYLASGTPILAAVPDGDARDLLASSGRALLARPSDSRAMADHLGARLHKPARAHRPAADFPWLERRHLTGELAAVFDRVLRGGALELAA